MSYEKKNENKEKEKKKKKKKKKKTALKLRFQCIIKGMTLLYFNTVIRWTRFKNSQERSGEYWTKACLFMYKRMHA